MVVLGHSLLTGITYQGGHLSGLDALDYVSRGRWVTLLFQVMPVFFLVGGYANAVSWTAHQQRGEGWTEWVRGRALRLLWPAAVYVAVIPPAVAVARAAGANTAELAQAGWFVPCTCGSCRYCTGWSRTSTYSPLTSRCRSGDGIQGSVWCSSRGNRDADRAGIWHSVIQVGPR